MSKLNIRFILKMLGFLLIIETFFMLLSTVVAFCYKGEDTIYLFACSLFTLMIGLIFVFIGRNADEHKAGKKEGAITVTLTWIVFSFFGMLPYYTSGAIPSVTDAFFETMSGFTTTGATILTDIEAMPEGLLFWRSITQWQGGMGMIVLTLAILPMLGGGATQLFDAESTGVSHDKFLPRATQVAKRLWSLYFGITMILVFLLWIGPMSLFDAVCHAFTTMATGGYSTKQDSIAYFHSPYVDYVVSIFMFIGALNFSLIYFLFKGKWKRFFYDEELRAFFYTVLGSVAIVTVALLVTGWGTGLESSFRTALFQVTTLITTTGFTSENYVLWGPFFWAFFLLLMLFCGCAGSTSGGMKMIRALILGKSTINEFKKYSHPKAVLAVRVNNHAVSPDVVSKVLAFVVIYIFLLLSSSLLFTAFGMGFVESLSASVTCMSNTGPGLGELGPAGSFAEVPCFVKWCLSFLMMTGRLELFTVISILTPGFWK
ncbi:MAG: TrkH family potassium uptake protein [Bacteroidales bacterium]|nr:TrkH family potassium uptake protein [Bacteroidales bacterium]